VYEDRALPVQDADIHRSRMQVDAAVMVMLRGVEAQGVSSSPVGRLPSASIPRWYAEEGASISIKGLQPTASSVRSSVAPASSGG
jgi:hypothetical protein